MSKKRVVIVGTYAIEGCELVGQVDGSPDGDEWAAERPSGETVSADAAPNGYYPSNDSDAGSATEAVWMGQMFTSRCFAMALTRDE
jgi:hypothetical protein